MAFWSWSSVMLTCRNCSTDSTSEWSTVSLMMAAPFEPRRIISTAGWGSWHARITARDRKGMPKRSAEQSTPSQRWFVEQTKFPGALEIICCKTSHMLCWEISIVVVRVGVFVVASVGEGLEEWVEEGDAGDAVERRENTEYHCHGSISTRD